MPIKPPPAETCQSPGPRWAIQVVLLNHHNTTKSKATIGPPHFTHAKLARFVLIRRSYEAQAGFIMHIVRDHAEVARAATVACYAAAVAVLTSDRGPFSPRVDPAGHRDGAPPFCHPRPP